MVLEKNLSPDPSNQPQDDPLPTEGINAVMPVITSSDSEDDDMPYEGYEMLPQDATNDSALNRDTDDSEDDRPEDEANVTSNIPTSTFDRAMQVEITQLWSSSENKRLTDIIMDSAKEELVKNAMAGFSLPSTSIPSWAKNVPEEEWKRKLMSQIQTSNKSV